MEKTKVRKDLMSNSFPSIWLETNETGQNPIIICGIYRVWTKDGIKSMEEQLKSMEVLNLQIVKGTEKVKSVIMLGDINLCSQKWNDKNFTYKKLAVSLKNTLLECGLHAISLAEH